MKKMIVSLMLVISMFAFAAESAPSATVGYVKYSNVVTAGTDLNAVAVAVQNSWTMSNNIDPTSQYFTSIQKWNPVTQVYANSYFSLGSWKNTFAIGTGDALLVNAKVANDLIVNGTVVTVPAYNLITTAGTDLNAIMLPLSKGALSTTALLGADIGSSTYCSSIQKWNSATQVYANSYFSLGSWKNVFDTYIADALMINMTNAKTWPVGGGKDEDVVGADWNEETDAPKAGLSRPIAVLLNDNLGAFYDYPADAGTVVTWKAWVTARPTEILRWNTPPPSGTTFVDMAVDGRLSAIMDMQDFPGIWAPGDVLNWTIKDEVTNMEETFSVTLDADVNPTLIGYDTTYGAGNDHAIAPFHAPLQLITPSSVEDGVVPAETKLHQYYPNPFNPTTTIKFDLAANSNVKLNVYNYSGQLLKSLVNGTMNAGFHAVNFDASSLSAGVYYYTLVAGNSVMSNKMILVK